MAFCFRATSSSSGGERRWAGAGAVLRVRPRRGRTPGSREPQWSRASPSSAAGRHSMPQHGHTKGSSRRSSQIDMAALAAILPTTRGKQGPPRGSSVGQAHGIGQEEGEGACCCVCCPVEELLFRVFCVVLCVETARVLVLGPLYLCSPFMRLGWDH
eukprot:scaffold19075_cov104-Isochrysis_galbana.AAC.3